MAYLNEQDSQENEIEIFGRAEPKEQIKTPIGEVQSFIQPGTKSWVENGATYTIGDPAGLAFWLSLDRNYEEEELNQA